MNDSEDELVLPDNHPAVYKSTRLFPEAWVQPVFSEVYGQFWTAARDLVFELREGQAWKNETSRFMQVKNFGASLRFRVKDAVGEFTKLLNGIAYAQRGRITIKTEEKIIEEGLSFARHLMSWNCAGSFLGWALGDGLPLPERDRIEADFRPCLEREFELQGWVELVIKSKMELERLRLVASSKSAQQDRADGEYVKAMRKTAKDGRVGNDFWKAMAGMRFETPAHLQKHGCPKLITKALNSPEWRQKLIKYKYEKTKRTSG
jgi:hypothetical protein